MRKGKLLFMIAAVCAALAAAGCASAAHPPETALSADSAQPAYARVSAREAKEMMDENKDAVVVDVRTREEYERRHIPGAISLPLAAIEQQAPRALSPSDAILVYCRSGSRSKQAAEKLAAAGYKKVFDFGGINDWPYETTVQNESKSTEVKP